MSFLAELRQVETPSRTSLRTPSRQIWAAPSSKTPRSALPQTSYPFAKAFVIAAVTYVVATAVLVLVVAPHATSGGLALGSIGGALGVFVISSFVPVFLTGMLVRQSRRAWGVARIAAAYLPLFLLVAALQFAGTAAEAWWPA